MRTPIPFSIINIVVFPTLGESINEPRVARHDRPRARAEGVEKLPPGDVLGRETRHRRRTGSRLELLDFSGESVLISRLPDSSSVQQSTPRGVCMTAPTSAVDNAPFLERCFHFDATEDSYEITDIQGMVPPWVRGTYYINGPARFERSGLKYRHWLDGDGMVCSLRFGNGSVRFTNRFVRTPKLEEETRAGHAIYRGFGTSFPGDKLRRGVMLEPPVNVSAYRFAGTLLAFGEQALPYELDPVTLETRGEYDFGGKLTSVSPFAAHPKFDAESGHMVNFGVSFSASQPTLTVYEFDPDGRLVRRHRQNIPYQHSNHDCMITRNHVVFHLSPLIMDFSKFWGEHVSVMESLRWEPEKGSRLLIAPRLTGGGAAFEIDAGQGYCLHLINAFEPDSRTLIVDFLELEAPAYPEYQPVPDMFPTVTPCRPVRYVIDVPSKRLIERIAMDYDRAPDFPSPIRSLLMNEYNDFWMLGISATGRPGRKFFDQLAHGSWRDRAVNDVFQTEPGQYLGGEPCPVTDPGDSSRGVVINLFVDARNERWEIALFDAMNVARGPIARLGLKHKVHPGFHTSFYRE
jgi:all-trans-8'-apo-beta-carotenal 15,15'-oxygenase